MTVDPGYGVKAELETWPWGGGGGGLCHLAGLLVVLA